MTPENLPGLIAAVALGDQAAFRRLYDETSAKLFGFALRIVRDEARAEEVLQDAFVNVWHAAGSYDARLAAPMTWLVTIVRNRALDFLRRSELPTVELDEELAAVLPGDDATPEQLLLARREAGLLADCLNRLEAGPRQAIAWAYYQGLSHSELANSMQVPIGTVKTWIRRGLERLKRCLEGVPGAIG